MSASLPQPEKRYHEDGLGGLCAGAWRAELRARGRVVRADVRYSRVQESGFRLAIMPRCPAAVKRAQFGAGRILM